ncbi:hypothetical protein T09_1419 [Trichinella sp. T9]|nr:hypothetical protein T09_1419 [Trichinella sp. T9]
MKKEQEKNFIIENIQFTSELYIFLSFQFKLSGMSSDFANNYTDNKSKEEFNDYTMPKTFFYSNICESAYYHVISIFRTAINVQPANYATGKILHKVQIAIAYFQNHCKYLLVNFWWD